MRSQRRTETKDVLLQRATSSLFVSREITDRKRERKRSVRLKTSISSYVFNHNLFLSPRSCLLFFLSPKQIRRRFAVLLHRQSKVVAQLQGHVVAGDPPLLSQHARLARRLQERSAFHVLRRDLLVLFQGSQPVYAVRRTITFSFWPTSPPPHPDANLFLILPSDRTRAGKDDCYCSLGVAGQKQQQYERKKEEKHHLLSQ